MPCDPLRDLRAWQERLERLSVQQGTVAWTPPVDVYETSDRYVVTAELPGFERDQIDVLVEQGRLTLKGTRRDHDGLQHYHQIERGRGPFARTFDFAEAIDGDAVSADLRDGILTVTLPKATSAPAHKIEVT